MKQLKFEAKLVPLILSGEKNVTWRLLDDKDLSVGDELELINSKTGEPFATAKIIEVKEKILGDIDADGFDGHEKFSSKPEMIETYRGYYGDRVDESSEVKIIKFELSYKGENV
jgi:hypothetical protein